MAVVTTVVAGVVAAAAAAAVVVDVVAAAAAVVVQGTRGHIRHHRQYRQAGWVDQGNPPYLLSRRCTCSSSTSGRMQAVMQQHVASELSQGTWGDHRGRMWQVFFCCFFLFGCSRACIQPLIHASQSGARSINGGNPALPALTLSILTGHCPPCEGRRWCCNHRV